MDKRLVLGIVVIFVIVAFFVRRWTSRQDRLVSPSKLVSPAPTSAAILPSEKLSEYIDGSGFSFKYPEEIKINEKEIDEETEYTRLKLTSSRAEGGISLSVVDSSIDSLDEWAEDNQDLVAAGREKEIGLGDIEAKEIQSPTRIQTAALDQGALFTIETEFGDRQDYWSSVYETLVSTFAFVLPEPAGVPAAAGPAPGGEIIFLGEEIVE